MDEKPYVDAKDMFSDYLFHSYIQLGPKNSVSEQLY